MGVLEGGLESLWVLRGSVGLDLWDGLVRFLPIEEVKSLHLHPRLPEHSVLVELLLQPGHVLVRRLLGLEEVWKPDGGRAAALDGPPDAPQGGLPR